MREYGAYFEYIDTCSTRNIADFQIANANNIHSYW